MVFTQNYNIKSNEGTEVRLIISAEINHLNGDDIEDILNEYTIASRQYYLSIGNEMALKKLEHETYHKHLLSSKKSLNVELQEGQFKVNESQNLSERRKAQLNLEKDSKITETNAFDMIKFLQKSEFTIKEALLATEKTISILEKIRKNTIKEKVDELVIPDLINKITNPLL